MKIKNLTVQFEEKVVYKDFSIEIPDNKITCILGASGCGKTTLLNVISDSINFSGEVEKTSNKISYIFQNPTILPHLTVEKNLDFILKNVFLDKKVRVEKIDEILKKVELFEVKNKYPYSLSGGMAQRLSVARGFVYPADIMLLDEPFKGLDISLKKRIIQLFIELYKNVNRTVIIVTHDIDEAILLADHIVILGENKIIFQEDVIREGCIERAIDDFSILRAKIYSLL